MRRLLLSSYRQQSATVLSTFPTLSFAKLLCVITCRILTGITAVLLLTVGAVVFCQTADAQTLTVLHTFTGGADGANSAGGLLRDAKGNLFGTTSNGGASNFGTVFGLSATGKYTILHSFSDADGQHPVGSLIHDGAGNFYGATADGGDFTCRYSGCGTVFKLNRNRAITVMHTFAAGGDGSNPAAGLIRDLAGNLYGTTYYGGVMGSGTVFKLDAAGNETILYSFLAGADGACPHGSLIRDAKGNLYGTTGNYDAVGEGTVFKLYASGKLTVLHNFTGSAPDGLSPRAGLVGDSAGNLFGTTVFGGAEGQGTVFKVDKAGNVTTVYSFTRGVDAAYPYAGLVSDKIGNLYGTTYNGGAYGFGTVFRLDSAGNESVLYSFTGGSDGASPFAGLVRDPAGNLYGTTYIGGDFGVGVIFKLTL